MQKLFLPNEKNNQMPVKHPIRNMPSKEGLTRPLVKIYWPDIRVVLVEECDLLVPIFTSISRSISHSSFNKQYITITACKSHNASSFIVKSFLLVINYKVSRQFIMSCTRGKKKSTYIRPEVWICGTRHSTVVYWPSENTSQILLWCYSTVTRRAIYYCSMLCLV